MNTIKQSVYITIVNDFKRKIELGLLPENEKLPSCRDYAMERGINPNTVQRAYSELEKDGYIYTLPKKGVYVLKNDGGLSLENAAREKISELKAAGIKRRSLENIINEIYGADNDWH